MRLLNVNSKTITDPSPHNVEKKYAILSHRWEEPEVTYQDISSLADLANYPVDDVKAKSYEKILRACSQALADECSYIWIDTCCIDKTNSAELSEAINSMFAWYKSAHICYAYLFDVKDLDDPGQPFSRSKWFERGWTLQELIAPERVIFYSKEWVQIGTRAGLSEPISRITGIDDAILTRRSNYAEQMTIAKRMSWAANRVTFKIEDRAYSLLGLFGVNMPVIYGEGENAFIRLQHEIMKISNDSTIFAWRSASEVGRTSGLLASSPDDFKGSSELVCVSYDRFADCFGIADPRPAYTITNNGIQIQLPLIRSDNSRAAGLERFVACLPCSYPRKDWERYQFYGIRLQKSARRTLDRQYVRTDLHQTFKVTMPLSRQSGSRPSRFTVSEDIFVKEDDSSIFDILGIAPAISSVWSPQSLRARINVPNGFSLSTDPVEASSEYKLDVNVLLQ